MVRLITPRLQMHERNPDVTGYVIRGFGDKAFCAGGDVIALHKAGSTGKVQDALAFFREEYRLNYLISRLAKPYVAWLNGITMGGGVGLSVHGRTRVATENSYFAMPETAIGFFPDVGGGHFLPRLENSLGIYLALTGARLRGSDLVHAGIATTYASQLLYPSVVNQLNDGHENMALYDEVLGNIVTPVADLKPFSLAPHLETIARCFSKESMEEIVEALKAETKDVEFARQTLKTLSHMSPLSLKVTLRQMQLGAALDLEDVLKLEYRMSSHMMHNPDFYEGVSKMLISKDRSSRPQWKHHSLAEVKESEVASFFLPPRDSEELELESVVPINRGKAFNQVVRAMPFVRNIPEERAPGEYPYPLYVQPDGDQVQKNIYDMDGHNQRSPYNPAPASDWSGTRRVTSDPGPDYYRDWKKVLELRYWSYLLRQPVKPFNPLLLKRSEYFTSREMLRKLYRLEYVDATKQLNRQLSLTGRLDREALMRFIRRRYLVQLHEKAVSEGKKVSLAEISRQNHTKATAIAQAHDAIKAMVDVVPTMARWERIYNLSVALETLPRGDERVEALVQEITAQLEEPEDIPVLSAKDAEARAKSALNIASLFGAHHSAEVGKALAQNYLYTNAVERGDMNAARAAYNALKSLPEIPKSLYPVKVVPAEELEASLKAQTASALAARQSREGKMTPEEVEALISDMKEDAMRAESEDAEVSVDVETVNELPLDGILSDLDELEEDAFMDHGALHAASADEADTNVGVYAISSEDKTGLGEAIDKAVAENDSIIYFDSSEVLSSSEESSSSSDMSTSEKDGEFVEAEEEDTPVPEAATRLASDFETADEDGSGNETPLGASECDEIYAADLEKTTEEGMRERITAIAESRPQLPRLPRTISRTTGALDELLEPESSDAEAKQKSTEIVNRGAYVEDIAAYDTEAEIEAALQGDDTSYMAEAVSKLEPDEREALVEYLESKKWTPRTEAQDRMAEEVAKAEEMSLKQLVDHLNANGMDVVKGLSPSLRTKFEALLKDERVTKETSTNQYLFRPKYLSPDEIVERAEQVDEDLQDVEAWDMADDAFFFPEESIVSDRFIKKSPQQNAVEAFYRFLGVQIQAEDDVDYYLHRGEYDDSRPEAFPSTKHPDEFDYDRRPSIPVIAPGQFGAPTVISAEMLGAVDEEEDYENPASEEESLEKPGWQFLAANPVAINRDAPAPNPKNRFLPYTINEEEIRGRYQYKPLRANFLFPDSYQTAVNEMTKDAEQEAKEREQEAKDTEAIKSQIADLLKKAGPGAVDPFSITMAVKPNATAAEYEQAAYEAGLKVEAALDHLERVTGVDIVLPKAPEDDNKA